MSTPRWDTKKNRWVLDVCIDGIRKQFTSAQEGRKGLKEVNTKYQSWLMDECTGEQTVNQVCNEYLEDLIARRGIEAPSYIQNERYMRLYIRPKLGKLKMNRITLRQWQAVINDARGTRAPLSKKTLTNLRAIISSLVKFGYQNYQCELLRGELYIPAGHSQKEKEILQPSEIRKLFEAPSDKFYYPLFLTLIATGLRPGEALGLKVEDVQGEVIHVKRAVNTQGNITEGKNANAKREVPIGATVRRILDDTIERNNRLKLDTEWVFCSPDGSVGNQSTMRNQWNELKAERELNKNVSVYGLRHTFVSLMKSASLPEQQIKQIVGHSISMSTFETYGHIVDGESKKSAQVIDLTLKELAK